ncbi:hypothetical protein [Rhodoplanes sp. Z2-YC6860]|uniref:hypothetical protein n=1 Tax=Rhodoplanes sp. Z2-YC6860 TaxID=674703 RepID=UPI0012ED4836|nr:hypothetical protein [Rhodoplanes sp. Z2-YC6860]
MAVLVELRHDRITAPWLLEAPIDGESFTTRSPRCGTTTSSSWTSSQPPGQDHSQLIRSTGAKLPVAKILARPQPDRTGICQASVAQGIGRTIETARAAIRELVAAFIIIHVQTTS